jgi:hypothetical protein
MARLLYIETFPAKSASHSVPDGQNFSDRLFLLVHPAQAALNSSTSSRS